MKLPVIVHDPYSPDLRLASVAALNIEVVRGLKIRAREEGLAFEIPIANTLPHLMSGTFAREASSIAHYIEQRWRERADFIEVQLRGAPQESLTIARYLRLHCPDLPLIFEVNRSAEVSRDPLQTATLDYAENLCRKLCSDSLRATTNRALPSFEVCIAHFNHGEFLPQVLESLEAQNYPNFVVSVVDDGSTDEASKIAFSQLGSKYLSRGWNFRQQANQGPSVARNSAALASEAEYIVFMDSDNLAAPQMLSRFAEAIGRSDFDALSCWFTAFDEAGRLNSIPEHGRYVFCPLGGSATNGLFENVYGDTNFAVRTSLFKRLGGFVGHQNTPWEDWAFLGRLNRLGHSFDVIPETLFFYRLSRQSRNRAPRDDVAHQKFLLRQLLGSGEAESLPDLEGFARARHLAAHARHDAMTSHLPRWVARSTGKLKHFLGRFR